MKMVSTMSAVRAAAVCLVGAVSAMAAYMPTVADFSLCPSIGIDTMCGVLLVIQQKPMPTPGNLNPDYPVTGVLLTDISMLAVVKPFDGSDDTLFGVLNESGDVITDISIGTTLNHPGVGAGNQAIFGFDSDGLCSFAFVGSAGCPFESAPDQWVSSCAPSGGSSYAGPNTRFSFVNINGGCTIGTIAFAGAGLANGAFAYFSLEDTFKVGDCVSLCSAGSSAGLGVAGPAYQIHLAALGDGTVLQPTVLYTGRQAAAVAAAPEPSSMGLLLVGLGGLMYISHRAVNRKSLR